MVCKNGLKQRGPVEQRLLSYEVDDLQGTVEQAWYDYGADGNVSRLIRWQDTSPSEARMYWFYYDTSDHLWLSVAATGFFDQEVGLGSLSNCVADKAAEYRYDGGRERYLVRPRDPQTLAMLPGAQWRDYKAESIYGDYGIDPTTGDVTQGTAYLAGTGLDDPSGIDMPAYLTGDLIGTTRAISGTNAAGPPVLREAAYTAFGEVVSNAGSFDTRYGYAGAWGYETAESFDPLAELGWLHVGHRYYDPASGRFVQRDPIGIRGGANVYVYVASLPSELVDPSGLQWMDVAIYGQRYVDSQNRPPPPNFTTLAEDIRTNNKIIHGSSLFCAGAAILSASVPPFAIGFGLAALGIEAINLFWD